MFNDFLMDDDAIANNDDRQPFHVLHGKVLTQQEWEDIHDVLDL